MPVTKINREVQKLKTITGSSEKTGWVKENVAHLLSGFVRYADVNLVVNIGHLWGKSALVFCDAMFNNRDFEDNWDPGDDPFSTHSRRNTRTRVSLLWAPPSGNEKTRRQDVSPPSPTSLRRRRM